MEANLTTNHHHQHQHNHHAIILPLSLQGHVNPCIQLSINLALRGFTISFITFEHVHKDITQASCKQSNNNDLFEAMRRGSNRVDIRYKVISDGLAVEFDRNGKLMEYLECFMNGGVYGEVEKAIESIVLESKEQVNVLIVDTFYPWASKLANKFGLRHVSFWTEPALVFNLYYHLHLLRQNAHFGCLDTSRKDAIDYIPGVKSIEPKDLMSYLQDKDTSTNMHKLLFKAYQDVRNADFVLCNTVQELEPDTISALQSLMPLYPIGPIFLSGSTKSVVPTSFWAECNCLEWLNDKAHGSVLYVSFGSLANFTKNDVMEIAYGLMNSEVDFIWVLRPRTVLDDPNDLLPLDIENVVQGRGIIVPWTNQIEVLSHQAIGGYVTHCGWNSILESIWCEVPMLCCPVFTDQFTNRKLVVDDWKIGINLCRGNAIVRDEIASQIKSFMGHEIKDELNKNIRAVRYISQSALGAGGSSERYVSRFIEQLSK